MTTKLLKLGKQQRLSVFEAGVVSDLPSFEDYTILALASLPSLIKQSNRIEHTERSLGDGVKCLS